MTNPLEILTKIRINDEEGELSREGVDFYLNTTPTPFLGWVDPDNVDKVIFGAYRAEAGYPWLDTIYVEGTSLKLNKAAAETIAITEDCHVYYAIDVSAGPPITATLGVTTPVPADTDTLRHVVLGYAEWDTDHVAWYKQQHFGNIIIVPEYEDCECHTYFQIAVGTYTGDGALALEIDTGLCKQLLNVKIWNRLLSVAATYEMYEKVDDSWADYALAHYGFGSNHSSVDNSLNTLSADGKFTVDDAGSDQHPNKNGVVYSYVAFA